MVVEELDEVAYDLDRLEERMWRVARERGMSRRRFLELLGVGGAGALLSACTRSRPRGSARKPSTTGPRATTTTRAPAESPIVKPLPEDKFFLHAGPEIGSNAEMRWEQMAHRGYLTGNDLFFIRNSTKTPRIDAAGWKLTVSGSGVAQPLELSYDDLLALPAVSSVIRFVECAGNGRIFYKEVQGRELQANQAVLWRLGAVGVAEWTGVPLGEVLERAGIKRTARDVMPQGLDPRQVRRPFPVAKALQDDTLLVFAMNGEPLPPDHGFPVRVLVPGWIGVANIKWVGSIVVAEEPLYSDWNTRFYVFKGPAYHPEGRADGPILSTQVVKSALELPWPASLPSGRHTVWGRSWSGRGRIARVEYTLDEGRTWTRAGLSGPNVPLAWARWSFPWDARPGQHTIRVRATDDRGNTQPDTVPFNEAGYLYGAVVGHPVSVA